MKILNARKTGTSILGAVYVGRPTKWGNPFVVGEGYKQGEACDAYEKWIITQPKLIEDMKRELKGKDLICWCSPKRCHAETIMRIANSNLEDFYEN